MSSLLGTISILMKEMLVQPAWITRTTSSLPQNISLCLFTAKPYIPFYTPKKKAQWRGTICPGIPRRLVSSKRAVMLGVDLQSFQSGWRARRSSQRSLPPATAWFPHLSSPGHCPEGCLHVATPGFSGHFLATLPRTICCLISLTWRKRDGEARSNL